MESANKRPKTYREAFDLANAFLDKATTIHCTTGEYKPGIDLGLSSRELAGEHAKRANEQRKLYVDFLIKHSKNKALTKTATATYSKKLLQAAAENASLQDWSKTADVAAMLDFISQQAGPAIREKRKV